MKKILVLLEGDIYSRRGYFNAVIDRTVHLKEISEYKIDVLVLSSFEPWYVRLIRHTPFVQTPSVIELNGLNLNISWRKFRLIDYISRVKLHRDEPFRKIHERKLIGKLRGYDLIIAHSMMCGRVAKQVKERFGTPYTVTWHGSDTHTEPFVSANIYRQTIDVIMAADMNFYVSKALLNTSNLITETGNKMVLYNGYNKSFFKLSDEQKSILRKRLGVKAKKVVTFAGNFLDIKNILKVPSIFKSVYEKFPDVEFWMVGDGKYRGQVEVLSKGLPIHFWGNQDPEQMPSFLNATDVLILPSKNEGLPLIVVEALACGCNVVGSLVGGIPEMIGNHNCISLNDTDFESTFADKVVSYLTSLEPSIQTLSKEFDWQLSATKEIQVIMSLID